jgi:hypothetical protein
MKVGAWELENALQIQLGFGAVQVTFIAGMFCAMCIMYLKYVVDHYFNELKRTSNTHVSKRMRFMRQLTATWVQVIVILGFMLWLTIMCVVVALLTFTAKVINFTTAYALMAVFSIVPGVAFFIIIGIAFVYDLYQDVKKHSWRGFLTERDPLNYRLDAILLFICAPTAILNAILVVIFSNAAIYSTPTGVAIHAIFVVIDPVWRTCFLLCAGLSCVIVIVYRSIVQYTQNKKRKETKQERIQRLLKKRESRDMFQQYCQREFSTENLYAWSDLELYHDIKEEKAKIEECHRIYDVYIKVGESVLEINLPIECRNTVKKNLSLLEGNLELQSTIFEDFQREVLQNLLDTFARYQVSPMAKRRRSSFSTN